MLDQNKNQQEETSNSNKTNKIEENIIEIVDAKSNQEVLKKATKKTTKKKVTVNIDQKPIEAKEVDQESIVDYAKFTLEELLDSLKKLINSEPIQSIKDDVNLIKLNFNTKFKDLVETKKEAFLKDGNNEIDFHFSTPIKKTFFAVFGEYKTKIQQYYNDKETARKDNFLKKTALIEELKLLISNSESSTMFNELKTIQETWRSIGAVPYQKNDDTWRTFRFHEQKVYDFLHLKSDFRNLDFKHNLEKKTKFVQRAQELTKEPDNAKAFKELQILHRLWKEDVGPVAREFREEIWEEFSAATKIIHDKRRELFTELEAKWEENVPKKEAVIQKINQLVEQHITSHNLWQNKIKELESLRDEFFKIGKVTNEKKDELWESLREATRNFNKKKNEFYKNIKNEHQENLDKKRALLEKVNTLKDSEDFQNTANELKKIQAQWKTIGHIPRKFSDKLWKEFRASCNHFFDKMHAVQDEANKELLEVFNAKKEYLDNLKTEIKDIETVALDKVKEYIVKWKELGQVPQKMRFIESKFNKVIDQLFSKLDLDRNETIMLRFKNNIESLVEQKNFRKLDNEILFIRKKIDETTKDVSLLENNLSFFKHVDKSNPMVKGVYKNIEKHQVDLAIWKQKLAYLKTLEY